MKVEVGAGTIGKNASHWGFTKSGEIICMVESPQVTILLTFATFEEARDHGCSAVTLATQGMLAKASAAGPQRSSLLVGTDGAPL